MNTRETLKINEKGNLEIGGCDTVELAERFGTPLYVMDEAYIRKVATAFKETLKTEYGDGAIAYASKAFSTVAIYKILLSFGLSADVVSGGEIYTALKADFNLKNAYFHGNNKLYSELELAISNGIGTIIVDNEDELEIINQLAKKYNRKQNIMLRVNPGVEAHTHSFIQTGRVDSKFGVLISSGLPEEIIKKSFTYKNLHFYGLHMHIGSQIFETEPFCLAIDILTDFVKKLAENGIVCEALNLGGGFGITYTENDPQYSVNDYCEYIRTVTRKLKNCLKAKGLNKPYLILEPGRSIVGEAGITLYTVGAIKNISGIRKYVSIDGGMFDNPRYALYDAEYNAIIANKATEKADDIVTIAGKCCESGDIIAKDIRLQTAVRGDIIAVFSTGAYNYSMSSNYNGNLVPPVVLVSEGKADYIVKPQSYEDLLRNNCVPDWLK